MAINPQVASYLQAVRDIELLDRQLATLNTQKSDALGDKMEASKALYMTVGPNIQVRVYPTGDGRVLVVRYNNGDPNLQLHDLEVEYGDGPTRPA